MKKSPEQTSKLWEHIKFSIKHNPKGGGIVVPQERFHNRWATTDTNLHHVLSNPFTTKDTLPPTGQKVSAIPSKRLRHIKNGKTTIEGKLDLHGKTVKEAATALDGFFNYALQNHSRTVMVITGKGSGKIQQCFFAWAKDKPFILSLNTADQKHGGSGAYYVFLRRSR